MPVSHVIDKQRRLVVTICRDRVTFSEVKAAEAPLLNDPDFNPDFNHLIDTTAVTVMDISIEEAKVIARGAIFSPVSKGAIVATDPAMFGTARLIEVHHEIAKVGDEIRTFYDRNAALKWLGLAVLPDPMKAEGAKRVEAVKATKNHQVDGRTSEPVAHEYRRSTRVRLQILIQVQGVTKPLACQGETIVVNLHGALISTAVALGLGMKLSIRVQITDRVAAAEVVYVDPDQPRHCGISLAKPQNIWGISLPPDDWHDSEQ